MRRDRVYVGRELHTQLDLFSPVQLPLFPDEPIGDSREDSECSDSCVSLAVRRLPSYLRGESLFYKPSRGELGRFKYRFYR